MHSRSIPENFVRLTRDYPPHLPPASCTPGLYDHQQLICYNPIHLSTHRGGQFLDPELVWMFLMITVRTRDYSTRKVDSQISERGVTTEVVTFFILVYIVDITHGF